jgi:hypothetical protein
LPNAEEPVLSAPFEQCGKQFVSGANGQAYNEKDENQSDRSIKNR